MATLREDLIREEADNFHRYIIIPVDTEVRPSADEQIIPLLDMAQAYLTKRGYRAGYNGYREILMVDENDNAHKVLAQPTKFRVNFRFLLSPRL